MHSVDNDKDTPIEFHINDENIGLTYLDFGEIYLMCESFLEEFYFATTGRETMNLEPYIDNANFKRYILQKIETGSKASINRVKKLNFGLKDIEWHLNEGYAFIDMIASVKQDVGGFGELHQFIISNREGKLSISDWYSKSAGNASYLDGIVRGDISKIDDPNIWNDKEWVDDIFAIIAERQH